MSRPVAHFPPIEPLYMGRADIIEKLDRFLIEHSTLNEECHVVYFMVEIRKILDKERYVRQHEEYPILRFYADWTVHTSKEIISPEIKIIMNKIFENVKAQIEQRNSITKMPPVMQFAYMQELQKEMANFLENQQLSKNIIETENWVQFASLLVKVLENQPIKKPTADISAFCFLPAAPRCVLATIDLEFPINGISSYRVSNAY